MRSTSILSLSALSLLLSKLPEENVYRAKGVMILQDKSVIVFNIVYGRVTYEEVFGYTDKISKMTFMGMDMERVIIILKSQLGHGEGETEYIRIGF